MPNNLTSTRGMARTEVLLSVICVLLLGILAALVFPREVVVVQMEGPQTEYGKLMGTMMEELAEKWTEGIDLSAWEPPTAEEEQETAFLSNLATIRQAINMYAVQHDDTFPADPVQQLTIKTNRAGAPGDVYGPYLRRGFPVNAINNSSEVRIVDESPTIASGNAGWIYVRTTGELRANLPGKHSNGEAFLEM